MILWESHRAETHTYTHTHILIYTHANMHTHMHARAAGCPPLPPPPPWARLSSRRRRRSRMQRAHRQLIDSCIGKKKKQKKKKIIHTAAWWRHGADRAQRLGGQVGGRLGAARTIDGRVGTEIRRKVIIKPRTRRGVRGRGRARARRGDCYLLACVFVCASARAEWSSCHGGGWMRNRTDRASCGLRLTATSGRWVALRAGEGAERGRARLGSPVQPRSAAPSPVRCVAVTSSLAARWRLSDWCARLTDRLLCSVWWRSAAPCKRDTLC